MNFLRRDDASLLDKKLRREIAEYAGPKFVLYYESGGCDYSRAADAIVQSTGSFSTGPRQRHARSSCTREKELLHCTSRSIR